LKNFSWKEKADWKKEAKAEIAHWFSESELFDYETAHEKFTQRKPTHLKK
jgi:hypothetical protein